MCGIPTLSRLLRACHSRSLHLLRYKVISRSIISFWSTKKKFFSTKVYLSPAQHAFSVYSG
ncbi:hypothetical protein HanIR_Chr04g0198171 [Helianthus annuus]|nr:hypothetical protein HanIR_Chr04g0198171 [Helianthus annuus]